MDEMARESGPRLAALIDLLEGSGRLDRGWRDVLAAVKRHAFVPATAWARAEGSSAGHLIDRVADPAGWWDAVYSDTSIITQFDDGAGDLRTGRGIPTCSCSAPGIVFDTLARLSVLDHHRVLEIGTGTGWTAALLARRLGDVNVTSIEVDHAVAAQAKENLAAAGLGPRLVVADGAAGAPAGAPYDRVHVTCAVSDIPYAWVEQTRPGGVIVAPWRSGYGTGWLARLSVLQDGRAVGRFVGLANYMLLRAQRRTTRFVAHHADEAARTTTALDPRQVIGMDHAADLVIGAMVPGTTPYLVDNDDGTQSLLLTDGGDSWASVDHEPGDSEFAVEQYGPCSLWDEVSSAYMWWSAAGSPGADRFGITVTPEGQQVWIDDPGCPIDVISGCSVRRGSRSR